MSVVLAMEEEETESRAKAIMLQREFGGAFANFWITVHPSSDPASPRCKSNNLAWALHEARRKLVAESGTPASHVVVTVMDADTVWHPQHFDCLTTLFATDRQRHTTYWQAPIRYHGNVWQSHALLRPLHALATAWELAYLAAPWWMALPMSSYSASLRLLVIADDWHMFIKSYFTLHERPRVRPVFLPFLAHVVTERTPWAAIKARYRQTLRHAWGAKEIGYTLQRMTNQLLHPRHQGAGLLIRVAHDNLAAGAGSLFLALGTQLPALTMREWWQGHLASFPFIVTNLALGIMAVVAVIIWWSDLRLRPDRPTPWTLRERLVELAALMALPTLTAVCVTLPVVHAQLRMMLGRTLDFEVTPKT